MTKNYFNANSRNIKEKINFLSLCSLVVIRNEGWKKTFILHALCSQLRKVDLWFMFQILHNWASPSSNKNRNHKSLPPVHLVWAVYERRYFFWYKKCKNTSVLDFVYVCVCVCVCVYVFFWRFAQFKEREQGNL